MRNRWAVGLAALLMIVGLAAQQGDVSAATSLSASVRVSAGGLFANTIALQTVQAVLAFPTTAMEFVDGTGLNQVDMVYTETRTVAASTTEDIDVDAGGLLDAFGQVFTIAELKALIICAATANTNTVTILGDANSVPVLDTAAATMDLKPGGCFVFVDPSAAGVPVTAATGDIIQVENTAGGTTVDLNILILGSSS